MTSGQQNTTSSFSKADDVRGSWCAEDAIVSDDELLYSICSSDLCNDLCDLWVPESAITTNNQCAALDAFGNGEKSCSDKGLGVVRLLEDLDLLTKT